jgi:hypothetical protein
MSLGGANVQLASHGYTGVPKKMYTKKKGKAVPLHAITAPGGERRYSSYSLLTLALDGGEWSASRPGHALPPGKGPPVPIEQEAEWAPEPDKVNIQYHNVYTSFWDILYKELGITVFVSYMYITCISLDPVNNL